MCVMIPDEMRFAAVNFETCGNKKVVDAPWGLCYIRLAWK